MSQIRLRNNIVMLKNKVLGKTVLAFSAALLLSGTAHAQINIDQLNAASAYDAGAIQSGGLDSALWQGVSATQATALIENIDTSSSGSARDLIRAALLSGGVPPQASGRLEREAYTVARLSAVLGLGDLSAFDSMVEPLLGVNRTSSAFTKVIAERALLGGDTQSACGITDENTVDRKSPYWAKMRAFCHVVRDEMPAAELTVDLLTRSDHKDDSFFSLLGTLTTPKKTNFAPDVVKTPLDTALARLLYAKKQISPKVLPPVLSAAIAADTNQEPDIRLAALLASAHVLSTDQIRSVLGGLSEAPLASAEQLASKNWDAKIWGGAYLALTSSNDMNNTAALAGALMAQADRHGLLAEFARALETETGFIPADFQAKSSGNIFTRTAVLRGDTGALRNLFQALEADDPLRGRIALASDALGNGFMLGELGVDIETRLALTDKKDSKAQARAVRDSYIAVAMGANLSQSAEAVLRKARLKGSTIRPGALLALQDAARRGSKAEVALRVAPMIDGKPLRADAFAAVLAAMVSVGMHEQAGQLAALDILQ